MNTDLKQYLKEDTVCAKIIEELKDYFIFDLSAIISAYARYKIVVSMFIEDSIIVFDLATIEGLVVLGNSKPKHKLYISQHNMSYVAINEAPVKFLGNYPAITIKGSLNGKEKQTRDMIYDSRFIGRNRDHLLFKNYKVSLKTGNAESNGNFISSSYDGVYTALRFASNLVIHKNNSYHMPFDEVFDDLTLGNRYFFMNNRVYDAEKKSSMFKLSSFSPISFYNDDLIGYYNSKRNSLVKINIPSRSQKVIFKDECGFAKEEYTVNVSDYGVCIKSHKLMKILVITENNVIDLCMCDNFHDACILY